VKYRYDVTEKGLRRALSGSISTDHIKLLRLIASKPLETLVQIGGIADVIDECVLLAHEHAAIEA
jgi:uncharacterized protein (UPF0264 family)